MGLTLHYELFLPAHRTRAEVNALLADLRHFSEGLGFAELSPVIVVGDEDEGVERRWRATAEFWGELAAVSYEHDTRPGADPGAYIETLVGDPTSAQVFFVSPGEGCELASFGFVERPAQSGSGREWYWSCDCKTQYAANISEAHFLACHTKLVRMLDRAIELGVRVLVDDEGAYWETRSETRLTEELRRINHIVARFAGLLNDALGEVHEIDAAIFAHPRFERLEMGEDEPRS